jgi:uncharacterized RDD family membrane protein YckC
MEPAYAGAVPTGSAYAPEGAYAQATMYPATPDGQFLAGWWQRVWAYLLDGIVVTVVGGLLASPWLGDVYDAYRAFFDQVIRDAEAGRPTSDATMTAFQESIVGPMMTIALIYLVVGFVYQVGFLMTVQATPGKLLLGLRVRLRERPGRLPLWSVLLRWAGQSGYSILSVVPVLGSLLGIYWLLDHLWPLWDGKKQAIHDKIARTNVVRVR